MKLKNLSFTVILATLFQFSAYAEIDYGRLNPGYFELLINQAAFIGEQEFIRDKAFEKSAPIHDQMLELEESPIKDSQQEVKLSELYQSIRVQGQIIRTSEEHIKRSERILEDHPSTSEYQEHPYFSFIKKAGLQYGALLKKKRESSKQSDQTTLDEEISKIEKHISSAIDLFEVEYDINN
ncbi:MAG: hypothetical protein ACPGJV_05800 [Bacteriovoracaceae bacterium]